jgi:RNA recognition motif-containing protein
MSAMFKIFIGNISFKTTEDMLRERFTPHMTIEDLVIARDEATGKSKGYGFVMTRDPEVGRKAMMRIGKFEIDGRLIYLKEAHGKKFKKKSGSRQGGPPQRRPDRPQGGGFNGGNRPRGNFNSNRPRPAGGPRQFDRPMQQRPNPQPRQPMPPRAPNPSLNPTVRPDINELLRDRPAAQAPAPSTNTPGGYVGLTNQRRNPGPESPPPSTPPSEEK